MSVESLGEYPAIMHTHASTWHDGGAALLTSDGEIYALASERIGDRYKHSWNSELASDYLKEHLLSGEEQVTLEDHTVKTLETGLEKNGHHFYHATSAYAGSGFDSAGILVVDGQGPEKGLRASTSIWHGKNDSIHELEMPYLAEGDFAPQSIGHFYTAIGALAGMKSLHEEGKTMGLAPYGGPSAYIDFFRQYVQAEDDGSYKINPDFTHAMLGNTLGPVHFGWSQQPPRIQKIWDEFMAIRQKPIRQENSEPCQEDANIAFAGQLLLEEVMLGLAYRTRELSGSNKLALAGGVALNSVVNGKIVKSNLFEDVFIFPAAGDDGQAIGKLYADIKKRGLNIRTATDTAYFGPEYSENHIKDTINNFPELKATRLDTEHLIQQAAGQIASGQVIGWFQGRSELGPRALGHRSILADPRDKNMRDYINTYVKHRELYRPFAPVVPEEKVSEYFDLDKPSPFMLIVADVLPRMRDKIPAITHVDGTARVQTITEKQDERYYRLVSEFGKLTGISILLNTSFNDKGEPIVETPTDALRSFSNMELDSLIIGNYVVTK